MSSYEGSRVVRPYEIYSKIYDPKEGLPESPILSYLDTLSSRYGLKTNSVLDLACGSGLHLKQLLDTRRSRRVVGLDISGDMLAVAKQRFEESDNVMLVHEDFRSFSLGEVFNTILCNFDSLNYVEQEREVVSVFECVRKHLTSSGFFVFDVINERHCLRTNGYSGNWERRGIRCNQSSAYDSNTKVKKTILRFAFGIEEHLQIPLEYDTIVDAAKETGLSVVGAYSNRDFDPISEDTGRIHFVLRN